MATGGPAPQDAPDRVHTYALLRATIDFFTREFDGRMGHRQGLNGQATDKADPCHPCLLSVLRLSVREKDTTPVSLL